MTADVLISQYITALKKCVDEREKTERLKKIYDQVAVDTDLYRIIDIILWYDTIVHLPSTDTNLDILVFTTNVLEAILASRDYICQILDSIVIEHLDDDIRANLLKLEFDITFNMDMLYICECSHTPPNTDMIVVYTRRIKYLTQWTIDGMEEFNYSNNVSIRETLADTLDKLSNVSQDTRLLQRKSLLDTYITGIIVQLQMFKDQLDPVNKISIYTLDAKIAYIEKLRERIQNM